MHVESHGKNRGTSGRPKFLGRRGWIELQCALVLDPAR
jgi:hypothetical protein